MVMLKSGEFLYQVLLRFPVVQIPLYGRHIGIIKVTFRFRVKAR